jgi:hypothetical protein
MSVDREYMPRISTMAENSSARQTAGDVKDAGTDGKAAGEDINVFEKVPDVEMRGLLENLNDVLPGAGRLLRAALELNMPGIFSTFESVKESARAEAPSAPPINQSKSLEESVVADSLPFSQPQNDPSNAGHDPGEFGPPSGEGGVAPSNESLVDVQTRAGLANQVHRFQKAFQTQGPAMSQQDAVDLLAVIRQLGEAFYQQGQNSVTRQDFEREKIALRRLIETKGK